MYLKLLTTIILFFLSFQSAFSNETILPIKKPDLNEKNTTKKIADIIPLPKPSEKAVSYTHLTLPTNQCV